MSLLSWNSKMSVGVARIDKEHQGLVEILNNLHDKMLEGKAKEALSPILEKLIQYTQTHFTTEETLFRTHAYPQAAPHKAEHDAFRRKADELRKSHASSQAGLSMETTAFLRDWLSKHIMGTDMQYKEFFASKGLK